MESVKLYDSREESRTMLDDRVKPHAEIVDTKLDEGEVVLLHLESKMYYSLNPTGERIWQGLKEGLSLREISRRLQEEFDVDEENANRSVLDLVNELLEQKLVLPDNRSSSVERSPEGRLLLLCARAKLTVEDLQLIARDLARPDLDWDYIAKTSCMHGIAPLIYDSLYRTGVISLLSSAVTETLRNTYYCNAARNSLLYDELRRVLLAFKKKGIKVIVLKGAVLAATVYRERALRPMSDIDLLVRKRGIERRRDQCR